MDGRYLARLALATAAGFALFGWAASASAALPKPIIERAQEANPVIYDAQLSTLDSNGRFALHLVGKNLAPDDESHPAQNGDYVHLYVRGVDASNVAGPWRRCGDDTCFLYGSTARTVINVGIRPSYYLSQPGSHLQFKVWVSPVASMSSDPEGNSSPWSEVYTVDRARAGAAAAVAANPGPTLVKLTPEIFTQAGGPSGSWQLTAYGDHVCGTPPRLVVNGDVDNAVNATGRCMGYDEGGKPLAGRESRLVYDLPDRYRNLGTYSVALLNEYGQSSSPMTFEVRGMTINPDVVIRPRVGPEVDRVVLQPIRPPEAVVPVPPVIETAPVPPPIKIIPIIPIKKIPPKR